MTVPQHFEMKFQGRLQNRTAKNFEISKYEDASRFKAYHILSLIHSVNQLN